jgi:proteasome lid subunit RPN8/RPN11
VVCCNWLREGRAIGLRRIGERLMEAARRIAAAIRPPTAEPPPPPLEPLAAVRVTDGVVRTLFAEYAAHRASERGREEIGWTLLGYREGDAATIVATLPAGADRDAGPAHVRFSADAQAVATRIIRQDDRRLMPLGIAHTHPGSLRRPSDGDWRGDSAWVTQLRGREGVFAIGTADAPPDPQPGAVWRPKPHRQCLAGLSWCWYSLAAGEPGYRARRVDVVLGPDLAEPLRPVWPLLEAHGLRLDRLARQLARVRFEVAPGRGGPTLAVVVPRAGTDDTLRVVLDGKEVRYFLLRGGDAFAADLPEPRVDQGVYLLLAGCAARTDDD